MIKKASEKIARVMHEFKHGKLKSGGRHKVTSRKQAVAIGLSEARRAGYEALPLPHGTHTAHAAKKTARQLEREIAEVLSGRKGGSVAHATKKDYDWNSFIEGAAFAFWASPYMRAVEQLADESREAYQALSPGPGGKWEDVLPSEPLAAVALAKKFTKAVKNELSPEELNNLSNSFSAYDAGYYGAMQSQGEGVGWFDEGVRSSPPRGFDYDPKIQNAVTRAILKGIREAGLKLSKR